MPSDPVKAVFWFLHWSLKVLVRYFWIAILGMVIFEVYQNWMVGGPLNGAISGVVTVLVGIGVWVVLYALMTFLNMAVGISQMVSQVNRIREDALRQQPLYQFMRDEPEEHVVEGTITDLEEERRKRKRETS